MTLRLIREPSDANGRTFGVLFVDGRYCCFTLEDQIRPVGEKVPGQTAIPAGRYRVLLTHSGRFQTTLPLVIGVPAFDGIRIHAGNTIADTAGCILVGKDRTDTAVLQSRVALDRLMATLRTDPAHIDLEIENPREIAQAA